MTHTPLPSPSFSPTALQGQPPRPGRPKPLQVLAVPNPQQGGILSLAIEMEADADSVRIGLYTKSMTRIGGYELRGPFYAGWNRLFVDLGFRPASGLYYVVVTGCKDNGESESAHVSKVFYLQ